MKFVALDGGVDLTSVKGSEPDGTLSECKNIEVGNERGYARVGGMERFDGRQSPTFDVLFYVQASDLIGEWNSILPTDGEEIVVSADGDIVGTGIVVYNVLVSANEVGFYFAFVSGYVYTDPSIKPGAISISAAGSGCLITNASTYTKLNTVGAAFDTTLDLATHFRTQIERVPGATAAGKTTSYVQGLHFFEDALYAVRDYICIAFNTGDDDVNGILNGHEIKETGGTSIGTVVSIHVDSGSLASSTGVGRIIIKDVDLVALGLLIVGDDLRESAAGAVFGKYNGFSSNTRAGMYKSSSTGWQIIDLGRELKFRGDKGPIGSARSQTAPLTVNRLNSQDDVVSNITESGFEDASAGGSASQEAALWADITEALTIGGASATNNFSGGTIAYTSKITLKKFDNMSLIPDGSRILGIEVRVIAAHAVAGNPVNRCNINLTGTFGLSPVKADSSTNWQSGTFVTQIYGSPTDLWGLGLTADHIQDDLFGVELYFASSAGLVTNTFNLQSVEINVHYTRPTTGVFLRREGIASSYMEIKCVQFYVTEGKFNTPGDIGKKVSGYMTVVADDDATKNAVGDLMSASDEIWTQDTGGNFIGLVAQRDTEVTLPQQSQLEEQLSTYQFITANFYALEDYKAFFGCNGAEPAFHYDGTYFIRIRTGVKEQEERPRHVCKNGFYLALGYKSGTVMFSDLGNPISFVEANEFPTGDRVTGLLELIGGGLGVFCENSIVHIKGVEEGSFIEDSISPNSGAIEYTVCDMGQPMFCDFRGVSTLEASEKFGDFSTGRLSFKVSPWLVPRLQSRNRNDVGDSGPVFALPIRNKSQYMVFFADGWWMRMTMMADSAQFTMGIYANTDESGIRYRCGTAGTESSGRDRVFFAADNSFDTTHAGYVYEFDRGVSFDGDEYESYLITNPIFLLGPHANERFDRCTIHGIIQNRATDVSFARATEFQKPDTTKTRTISFEKSSDYTTQTLDPFRQSVDFPIEGRDIAFYLSHTSDIEHRFVTQAILLLSDHRGVKR